MCNKKLILNQDKLTNVARETKGKETRQSGDISQQKYNELKYFRLKDEDNTTGFERRRKGQPFTRVLTFQETRGKRAVLNICINKIPASHALICRLLLMADRTVRENNGR